MKIREEIEELLDGQDWGVTSCDIDKYHGEYCAELEAYSPAGEDVIMTVWFDGTLGGYRQAVKKYAEDWDPDENVLLWAGRRGERGVPDTIRELVDDANAIKEMMVTLDNYINPSPSSSSLNADISLTLELREGESFDEAKERLENVLENAFHDSASNQVDYIIQTVNRAY